MEDECHALGEVSDPLGTDAAEGHRGVDQHSDTVVLAEDIDQEQEL